MKFLVNAGFWCGVEAVAKVLQDCNWKWTSLCDCSSYKHVGFGITLEVALGIMNVLEVGFGSRVLFITGSYA